MNKEERNKKIKEFGIIPLLTILSPLVIATWIYSLLMAFIN